jgi:hypothetical protein
VVGAAGEKLNTYYVCKACSAGFIFRGDLIDHQRAANHTGIFAIPLDERYVRTTRIDL